MTKVNLRNIKLRGWNILRIFFYLSHNFLIIFNISTLIAVVTFWAVIPYYFIWLFCCTVCDVLNCIMRLYWLMMAVVCLFLNFRIFVGLSSFFPYFLWRKINLILINERNRLARHIFIGITLNWFRVSVKTAFDLRSYVIQRYTILMLNCYSILIDIFIWYLKRFDFNLLIGIIIGTNCIFKALWIYTFLCWKWGLSSFSKRKLCYIYILFGSFNIRKVGVLGRSCFINRLLVLFIRSKAHRRVQVLNELFITNQVRDQCLVTAMLQPQRNLWRYSLMFKIF